MNILLTSAGRRSYLVDAFKEVLDGEGEVHVANSSEISSAFASADKTVVTPLIYEKTYIPFLKEYCCENDISAIISLFDVDLPILSKRKDEFKDIGVTVIVSDIEIIDVCNDKWKTFQFLIENKIKTPQSFLMIDDVMMKILEGSIRFPVVVKPRWGMGSLSVFEADNEEELRILVEKVKRNIKKSYLKYESSEDLDRCVIIQEKVSGQEYGLDVINDLNGNYFTTISKMKYTMRAGETDCAITVDNTELGELGENLGRTLGHIANLDVDVFLSDKEAFVLEMNARFGGGYPFSHVSGADLPRAIVKWLKGEEVEKELLIARNNVVAQKDIKIICLEGCWGLEKN
ncbi:carbamoyl-phosphate synthase large subunit [Lachnospiraceae bacterium PFB1-21]